MWLSTSALAFGSLIQALLFGVMIAPGPTALTRMLRSAYSRARVFVMFSMPPLLMEYGTYFGFGMISCTLELFTMAPPPFVRNPRIASLEHMNAPRKLIPK